MKVSDIMLINEEKEILLVKRNKSSVEWWLWSIPWWILEQDETYDDAVVREIYEELWIKIASFHKFTTIQISEYDVQYFYWNIESKLIKKIQIDHNELSWFAFFSKIDALKLDLAFSQNDVLSTFFESDLY